MLLVNKLKKYNSFSYKNFFPFYIPSKKETLDIDTIEDFKLAQMLSLENK